MGRITQPDSGPPSPFDHYLHQALGLIEQRGELPVATLAAFLSSEFQWLPGFCDVIVSMLRTNRLITINDWEPGKLRISRIGERFVATREDTYSVTQ